MSLTLNSVLHIKKNEFNGISIEEKNLSGKINIRGKSSDKEFMKNIGTALDLVLPNDAKIYLGEAGYIPYYAKREIYDLHGLGTKMIAQKGLTYEFLENKKIDLFILYAKGCNESQTNKKRFPQEISYINQNKYKFVGSIPFNPNLCLNLYSSPEYEKYFYQSIYLNNFDNTETNNLEIKKTIFKNIFYSYKYLFSRENIIPK